MVGSTRGMVGGAVCDEEDPNFFSRLSSSSSSSSSEESRLFPSCSCRPRSRNLDPSQPVSPCSNGPPRFSEKKSATKHSLCLGTEAGQNRAIRRRRRRPVAQGAVVNVNNEQNVVWQTNSHTMQKSCTIVDFETRQRNRKNRIAPEPFLIPLFNTSDKSLSDDEEKSDQLTSSSERDGNQTSSSIDEHGEEELFTRGRTSSHHHHPRSSRIHAHYFRVITPTNRRKLLTWMKLTNASKDNRQTTTSTTSQNNIFIHHCTRRPSPSKRAAAEALTSTATHKRRPPSRTKGPPTTGTGNCTTTTTTTNPFGPRKLPFHQRNCGALRKTQSDGVATFQHDPTTIRTRHQRMGSSMRCLTISSDCSTIGVESSSSSSSSSRKNVYIKSRRQTYMGESAAARRDRSGLSVLSINIKTTLPIRDKDQHRKKRIKTSLSKKRRTRYRCNSTTNLLKRERWPDRASFILASVGAAAGLGNFWRFPSLCYQHGGLCFIIAYVILLFLLGIPLLILEFSVGQIFQGGIIKGMDSLSKRLRGVGVASIFTAISLCSYYSVLISYNVIYLFYSVNQMLPWMLTDGMQQTCMAAVDQASCEAYHFCAWIKACTPDMIAQSRYFFYTSILGLAPASAMTPSIILWKLVAGTLFVWVCITLAIARGPYFIGQVAYFTMIAPLIIIIMLTFFTAGKMGASVGIAHYIGDLDALKGLTSSSLWSAAASQVIFSLSLATSTMSTLASYNPVSTHNLVLDCLLVTFIDLAISIVSGFAVFSLIGFVSHSVGIAFSSVPSSFVDVTYITYPIGLASLPGAQVFCVLFFATMFLLGIDSAFSCVEGAVTAIADSRGATKLFKRRRVFGRPLVVTITCFVSFGAGLIYCTDAEIRILEVVDFYISNIGLIFIGLLESVSASWVDGWSLQAKQVGPLAQCLFTLVWLSGVVLSATVSKWYWKVSLILIISIGGSALCLLLCSNHRCAVLNRKLVGKGLMNTDPETAVELGPTNYNSDYHSQKTSNEDNICDRSNNDNASTMRDTSRTIMCSQRNSSTTSSGCRNEMIFQPAEMEPTVQHGFEHLGWDSPDDDYQQATMMREEQDKASNRLFAKKCSSYSARGCDLEVPSFIELEKTPPIEPLCSIQNHPGEEMWTHPYRRKDNMEETRNRSETIRRNRNVDNMTAHGPTARTFFIPKKQITQRDVSETWNQRTTSFVMGGYLGGDTKAVILPRLTLGECAWWLYIGNVEVLRYDINILGEGRRGSRSQSVPFIWSIALKFFASPILLYMLLETLTSDKLGNVGGYPAYMQILGGSFVLVIVVLCVVSIALPHLFSLLVPLRRMAHFGYWRRLEGNVKTRNISNFSVLEVFKPCWWLDVYRHQLEACCSDVFVL